MFNWNNANATPGHSIVNPNTGKIDISIKRYTTQNNEALLWAIAHEIEELRILERAFADAGGSLRYSGIKLAIEQAHDDATLFADRFIQDLRKAGD